MMVVWGPISFLFEVFNIKPRTVIKTIVKSKIFQESLKNRNPYPIIFIVISIEKITAKMKFTFSKLIEIADD